MEERQKIVEEYLGFLCKRVDLLKLMASLNNPIEQDPLKILKQIQAYEDDESTINQEDSTQNVAQQQQILPYQFFCKVDREFVIMQRMKSKKLSES